MPSLRWLKRHGAPEVAQPISLVVGLGNPGSRYASSRHNVGFLVADRFARDHHFEFARKRFNAQYAEGQIEAKRVIVIKPQTFMNSSGDAVGKFFSFYKIEPQNMILIYDDLDLPLGKIRLRAQGSSGGHHGMESIISRIGTSDFPRLRIGIGRPSPDADIDHVLGEFEKSERKIMDETFGHAADAVTVWLTHGIDTAMNRFN